MPLIIKQIHAVKQKNLVRIFRNILLSPLNCWFCGILQKCIECNSLWAPEAQKLNNVLHGCWMSYCVVCLDWVCLGYGIPEENSARDILSSAQQTAYWQTDCPLFDWAKHAVCNPKLWNTIFNCGIRYKMTPFLEKGLVGWCRVFNGLIWNHIQSLSNKKIHHLLISQEQNHYNVLNWIRKPYRCVSF